MARFLHSDQVLEAVGKLSRVESPMVRALELQSVGYSGERFPIWGFVVGSQKPEAPTFGLFGGVHGVERIGAQVALAFLRNIAVQLEWNQDLRNQLQDARIICIPVVNPVGVIQSTRCNGNGVDLMRNAPLDSDDPKGGWVSGHRISSWLPWYRGPRDAPMEIESQNLVRFVEEYGFQSSRFISLDVHSGFGMRDRIWYPYAASQKPFPDQTSLDALVARLNRTIPEHIYTIERQSQHYRVHGDLWDYLYQMHRGEESGIYQEIQLPEPQKGLFLPLTLELGSWLWLRKNPLQILNSAGLFHPLKPHRYNRILRRHMLLLHFLFSIVRNGLQ